MAKTLTLGMFQHLGPAGAWRLPSNTSVDYLDLDHWITLAKDCEAAGVDFLFFADDYGFPLVDNRIVDVAITDSILFPKSDPMVLMTALAAVTEKIGLVATFSTTIEKPQTLARRLATLDHFTKGRVGWNIVTGAGQNASARLFGETMIPHDQRYVRAEEHVQLTMKLWEGSWEDDALKQDKQGMYADPSKVHEIIHHGAYFDAEGPLTVPPSPQRTPVLFQAGTSASGRDLAAQYAEAIFLAAEPETVKSQIDDIKARAAAFGRAPDAIKFLMAGSFIVAPTDAEAEALREQIIGFQTLETAAAAYAFFTGLDLLSMDLDQPLATTKTEQGRTNVERFSGETGAPALTVRQILEEFRRNGVMGNPFVGSPTTVVDHAQAVIDFTGADGFLVQPDPDGVYTKFIELVMPEMRSRGLIDEAPAGPTLRERLFGEGNARLSDEHPAAAYRVSNRALAGN